MSPYIIHAGNRIAHFLDITTVAVSADLPGNRAHICRSLFAYNQGIKTTR